MTRWPFSRSASQRCEPRKPAPPVTRDVGIPRDGTRAPGRGGAAAYEVLTPFAADPSTLHGGLCPVTSVASVAHVGMPLPRRLAQERAVSSPRRSAPRVALAARPGADGRGRRPAGHGHCLPLDRRRQYEPGQARENDFYGADAQGHGEHAGRHRPAVRRRGPAARRPRRFPGGTGTSWARRSTRTTASPRLRRCRRQSRATGHETGPDLPRDELGREPVRLEPACDREQRRPQGRPPQPRRAGLSRGRRRMGRHHPAVRLRRRERQAAGLPRAQLDAPRARRSTRTAATSPHAAGPDEPITPILECVEDIGQRDVPRPLRLRQPERPTTVTPPATRTSSRPSRRPRAAADAFGAGRFEDVFQVEFSG